MRLPEVVQPLPPSQCAVLCSSRILLASRESPRRSRSAKLAHAGYRYAAPSFNLFRDHSVTGRGSSIGLPRFGQLSAYSPVSVAAQITLRSHLINTLSTVRSHLPNF